MMKSSISESIFQQCLTQFRQINVPICPGKKRAVFVCLNSNCQILSKQKLLKNKMKQDQPCLINKTQNQAQIRYFNPFICDNNQCYDCYIRPELDYKNEQNVNLKYLSTHPNCFKGDFQSIVSCIQHKKKQNLPLKTYINQIFDDLINYLSQIRDQYVQQLNYYGLSQNQKFFLQCLKKQKYQLIDSKLCFNLVKNLDLQTDVNSMQAKEKLHQFWQEQQKKIKNSIQLMQRIIFKHQSTSSLRFHVDSKIIIKSEEKQNIIHMIQSQLGNKVVGSLNLIYRASENQFRTDLFHTQCDHKPNTLVVIETQFGKKIGGFTPLRWDKTQNNRNEKDPTNSTFVFSLTNNHKFTLKPGHQAAIIQSSAGPTFGRCTSDIYLTNKSNTSRNQGNIGNSYVYAQYQFGVQNSWTKFSGSVSGKQFKTKQWEVFQVILKQKS